MLIPVIMNWKNYLIIAGIVLVVVVAVFKMVKFEGTSTPGVVGTDGKTTPATLSIKPVLFKKEA